MSSLRLHPRETSEWGEEQGVVLVVVLWIMAFLAVLVGSFAYSTQVGLRLAHQKAAQAEARAVAQGALAYAAYSLTRPPIQSPVPPDGSPIERAFEGGQARISATNLAGLVKLHAVPRALLMRLLARLGIEPELRQRLVSALLDWRDKDDQHRAKGAESDAYERVGRRFGPKNAEFQSVAELRQVLGMPKSLAKRLGKLVTVQGVGVRVDPRTAPAEVLAAITGRDLGRLQEFTRQRARAYRAGKSPPLFPTRSPWLRNYRSPFYRIRIRAAGSRGGVVEAVAVIKLFKPEGRTEREGRPFRLVEWRESPV